ncbi:MAG: choice-of-anchor V domain-containing protein [Panacibacter sp.]
MFKNPRNRLTALYQQKKKIIITCCLSTVCLLALLSYKVGPAKNGQGSYRSPFNSSLTCAKCHNGGSYGGTIVTQLLDSANKVVKTYVPGRNYTFKIQLKKTSTLTTKYGFQTTAATSTNVNVNKWGTLPANTHNTLLSGHNYVEQSTALTPSVIKIPWVGPVKGTGSVKFYTAGNIVDNTGGTSGDQPVNKTLIITEGAALLPFTLNNISGSIQNNNAVISWSASNEMDVHTYTVEKNTDNVSFKEIGSKMVKGDNGDYSFTDAGFDSKAYYRVKVTDIKGSVSFSDAVKLIKPDKLNYKLSLYNHAGYASIMFSNGGKAQKAQVVYTDIMGKPLSSGITFANEGDNMWDIPHGSIKGIVIVNVITEDGIRTSLKFATNR